MKIKIVVMCLLLLVAGCISAEYSPKSGVVKYGRLGDMDASGIHIEIDPNGTVYVEVATEKNTGLDAALNAIGTAYQTGLAAGLATPK